MEGPKGLHLCANVNLPYLLELGVDILSFDAYQIEFMPKEYANVVAEFLKSSGVISWGVVPTELAILAKETPATLAKLLIDYWEVVSRNTDLSLKQIAEQALLAPARCCLKGIGQVDTADETAGQIAEKDQVSGIEERIVEKAFAFLPELSQILREKCGL